MLEQDFYLIGLDRSFLSSDGGRGFILTVGKDEKDIVFNGYIDVVNDMYSIGNINLSENANSLDQNLKSLSSIENKIKAMQIGDDEQVSISQLRNILSPNEEWFLSFLTKERWCLTTEHMFDARELAESIKIYKSIVSLTNEYNLTNASTFGD